MLMARTEGSITTAHVTVLSGPLAGSVVEVGEKLTLGRRPENTLRIRDDQVSRFHAVIERHDDHYVVEDLGSRTGTVVNGRPIVDRTELASGSELVIGQTVLRFDTGSAACPSAELAEDDPTIGVTVPPEDISATITLDIDRELFSSSELSRKSTPEVRRTSQHLQTLLSANAIIASELDLEKLFEKMLDQIFRAIPAHRAVIMTRESEGEPLHIRASRTGPGTEPSADPLVSQTIVNRALRDCVGILTLDAGADDRFDARRSIVDQRIRSVICVPMVHQETVLGVIYLDTVGVTHAFKEDDLKLMTGIAGPAAGAVRNAMLVARLRNTAIDTILRLAVAAEYRDGETGFHIHRMSDYAEAIARGLGLPDAYCRTLKLAAPMHDVGKIGIRDAILKKPGRLTPEEFEEMKQHTVKGGAILANSDSELLQMAEQIAVTHHEKFNGGGYPRGLAGDAIPIAGRIVAVADVFDALTNKRCYKPAFSLEHAFGEISRGAGAHFDPEVVTCFLDSKDRILRIRDHYLALEASRSAGGDELTPDQFLARPPPPPPG